MKLFQRWEGDLPYILSSSGSLWLTGLLAINNSQQGTTTLGEHLQMYRGLFFFWLSKWLSIIKLAFRGQRPGILNMPKIVPHRKDYCTSHASISPIGKHWPLVTYSPLWALFLSYISLYLKHLIKWGLSKCGKYIALFVQCNLCIRLFSIPI